MQRINFRRLASTHHAWQKVSHYWCKVEFLAHVLTASAFIQLREAFCNSYLINPGVKFFLPFFFFSSKRRELLMQGSFPFPLVDLILETLTTRSKFTNSTLNNYFTPSLIHNWISESINNNKTGVHIFSGFNSAKFWQGSSTTYSIRP